MENGGAGGPSIRVTVDQLDEAREPLARDEIPFSPKSSAANDSLDRKEGLICGWLQSMIFMETSPRLRLYSKIFVKQK
jgi:hypothetical protein